MSERADRLNETTRDILEIAVDMLQFRGTPDAELAADLLTVIGSVYAIICNTAELPFERALPILQKTFEMHAKRTTVNASGGSA